MFLPAVISKQAEVGYERSRLTRIRTYSVEFDMIPLEFDSDFRDNNFDRNDHNNLALQNVRACRDFSILPGAVSNGQPRCHFPKCELLSPCHQTSCFPRWGAQMLLGRVFYLTVFGFD